MTPEIGHVPAGEREAYGSNAGSGPASGGYGPASGGYGAGGAGSGPASGGYGPAGGGYEPAVGGSGPAPLVGKKEEEEEAGQLNGLD